MSETPIRNKLLSRVKTLSIPASPLMKTLGYGTGVIVYKLERSPSRSPWVLKRVSKRHNNEEMNVRLKCEAEVLRRLNHPNIVGFRALINETDGRNCIAMEDCTISLGDLIEHRVEEEQNLKPFSLIYITKMMTDISSALEYLHYTALILHADVKSYNVLVKDDFKVCKLCDFGVSFPLKIDGTIDEQKYGAQIEDVGTPAWFAPEIFKEPPLITAKADIYAYGLVIWEMIALIPPNVKNIDDTFEETFDGEDDDEEDDYPEEDNDGEGRVRPKVPCEFLDDSYLPVLQIFHLCTEKEMEKRPNAKDLCLLIKDIV